jgi:hypothetical protein
MRSLIAAGVLGAFALTSIAMPVLAAKSKMGCEIGKEVWDASAGKCVPGTAKWNKKAGGKSASAKKKPATK